MTQNEPCSKEVHSGMYVEGGLRSRRFDTQPFQSTSWPRYVRLDLVTSWPGYDLTVNRLADWVHSASYAFRLYHGNTTLMDRNIYTHQSRGFALQTISYLVLARYFIKPCSQQNEMNWTELPTAVRELALQPRSRAANQLTWPITCRVIGSTWCRSVQFSSVNLLWTRLGKRVLNSRLAKSCCRSHRYLSSGLMYQSECHFQPCGGTKSSLFNSICSSSNNNNVDLSHCRGK